MRALIGALEIVVLIAAYVAVVALMGKYLKRRDEQRAAQLPPQWVHVSYLQHHRRRHENAVIEQSGDGAVRLRLH